MAAGRAWVASASPSRMPAATPGATRTRAGMPAATGSVGDQDVDHQRLHRGPRGGLVPDRRRHPRLRRGAWHPGVTARDVEGKLSLRASVTSELVLDEVRLPDRSMPCPGARGCVAGWPAWTRPGYGIGWGVLGAARTCDRGRGRATAGAATPSAGPSPASSSPRPSWRRRRPNWSRGGWWPPPRRPEGRRAAPARPGFTRQAGQHPHRPGIARQARTILGGNGITLEYPVARHMANLEAVLTYQVAPRRCTPSPWGKAITGEDAFSQPVGPVRASVQRRVSWRRGEAEPRRHRHQGQRALLRRDDARRVGEPRPRRVGPDHPPCPRRRHQLRRHRGRLLRRGVGRDRREGPRLRRPLEGRARDQGARSRWGRTRTSRGTRGAGSSPSARTACAGSGPTTSTSTRSTGPTRRPTSTRPSGALTDLVRAGKIRYFGQLDLPADRRSSRPSGSPSGDGRERFMSEQPPYSILCAGVEADVLPVVQRYRMGVISWSPLAGGWLSGRFRGGRTFPPAARSAVPRSLRPVPARATRRSSSGRPARRAGRRGGPDPGPPRAGLRAQHPRSPRRSSGRARWSSSRASSARRRSASTRPLSTGSTRSSRPAPT